MIRVIVTMCFFLFILILLQTSYTYAGAFPCENNDALACGTEEGCTNPGNCAVGGGASEIGCNWCGTFCADSCPATGPVSVVPTMNQWGMIFAGLALGIIGIFAVSRERKINRYFD